MNTPARLMYQAAGSPTCPKPTTEAHGPCWVCALPCEGSGVLVRKAVGESFTDHANVAVPDSDYICVPCTWALSGKPPNTFRLWTVIWRTDKQLKNGNAKAPLFPPACLTAKNDLTELVNILLNPPRDGSPWFAAIADSGQKHVLPFTPLNHGPYWNVRFEDETIHGSPLEFGQTLSVVATLYAAGFNREEIATGKPRPSKLIDSGFDFWRKHNKFLRIRRGGSLLRLAIFLLRKEGIEDVRKQARGYTPPGLGGEPCPWSDEKCKHGGDSSRRLVDASTERTPQRRSDGPGLRTDGVNHGAQVTDSHVQSGKRQYSLFDRNKDR